ncbi:GTPase Era [Polystyrenella longa]|uniref:GTPase Era n=1 Tax=Polystyrenella longa TaxID=2528007 RepID=A0A518CRR4_9PLAN|nr:GTPase domain-containing protein [Polystyrenella longa]QDU81905.1 GTPase Era [Polystyrenella longa]
MSLTELATQLKDLKTATEKLHHVSHLLQIAPLKEREWFQLIEHKLLPQMQQDSFLIAAVVGGTNIGKSAIFNRLAGEQISSVSPLASGTKHPVCLVPTGFNDRHQLDDIFNSFELQKWADADEALQESDTDYLFWREAENLPPNLLILDTPDIDSDAMVNWDRADKIRLTADVLITVLTQQKYNDAAVKEFFRKAAAEDKVLMVVFNQCQLPEDEEYWPIWLETFCATTGARPEYLYLVPSDRTAVTENRLLFLEREYRQPGEAASQTTNENTTSSSDLATDLSQLKFQEIKLRTLQGSLKEVLHPQKGVSGFLTEIERVSQEFRVAAEKISTESVTQISDWPILPNSILVHEIRQWWKDHQTGWARNVQSVYDTVGAGITKPFKMLKASLGGETTSPLEEYRKRERAALLKTVEEIFKTLSWMRDSSSTLIRPNFEKALAGHDRAKLLERLKARHDAFDLKHDLKQVVHQEMSLFQKNNPEAYRLYQNLNQASAAVRPVTSVALFTLGWGPAGELVAPVVVPFVADFITGTVTAVAGEQAVTSTASSGIGFLQSKFQKLQDHFTRIRVQWMVELIKEELLGNLPGDLQQAASLNESPEFKQVEAALLELKQQMKTVEQSVN